MANKKPKHSYHSPARVPVPGQVKKRDCLMCQNEMVSRDHGERVCGKCKDTSAWRSGSHTFNNQTPA